MQFKNKDANRLFTLGFVYSMDLYDRDQNLNQSFTAEQCELLMEPMKKQESYRTYMERTGPAFKDLNERADELGDFGFFDFSKAQFFSQLVEIATYKAKETTAKKISWFDSNFVTTFRQTALAVVALQRLEDNKENVLATMTADLPQDIKTYPRTTASMTQNFGSLNLGDKDLDDVSSRFVAAALQDARENSKNISVRVPLFKSLNKVAKDNLSCLMTLQY